MKNILCKRCDTPIAADDIYLIHCTKDMMIFMAECYICEVENIIECRRWAIK